jgi:hypothetical protein
MEAMEASFAARIGADRWADVRTALEILFTGPLDATNRE